jgi:hypothetical protein
LSGIQASPQSPSILNVGKVEISEAVQYDRQRRKFARTSWPFWRKATKRALDAKKRERAKLRNDVRIILSSWYCTYCTVPDTANATVCTGIYIHAFVRASTVHFDLNLTCGVGDMTKLVDSRKQQSNETWEQAMTSPRTNGMGIFLSCLRPQESADAVADVDHGTNIHEETEALTEGLRVTKKYRVPVYDKVSRRQCCLLEDAWE